MTLVRLLSLLKASLLMLVYNGEIVSSVTGSCDSDWSLAHSPFPNG